MIEPGKPKGTVVTGVIGDDVHIVGVRILEYALGQAGFRAVPLGSQVSQKEFVDAAIETNADAIFISSLSGHAEGLIPGLREKCIEAGHNDTLLYLGGYLFVGGYGKVLRRSLGKWALTGSTQRACHPREQSKTWKRTSQPEGGK
jgi:methylaspartate mutase S subunit